MTTNALGEQSWPKPVKKAGQLVLEYEDHYLFYLRKEVYHKAAYGNPSDKGPNTGELSEWNRFASAGNADPEGVGLNRDLYKIACLSRREDFKDLIIYDNVGDTFYILEDHERMLDWVYQEKRKGKTLMITPLEAYREEAMPDNVDSNIPELNPARF